MNKNKLNKRGFTLAEVLITVLVLGIIAVFCIPLAFNKIKQKDLESRFVKANSVLKQTISLAESTDGNFSNWAWVSSDKIFFEYFTPHLSVLEVCKPNEVGCGEEAEYKYLSGKPAPANVFPVNLTRFITADGAKWLIGVNSNCTAKGEYCALVRVDVNGEAPPNQYGRDLFTFFLLPYTNEVKPEGLYEFPLPYDEEKGWISYERNEIEEDCNAKGGGTLCGAKIVLDGYKMKY